MLRVERCSRVRTSNEREIGKRVHSTLRSNSKFPPVQVHRVTTGPIIVSLDGITPSSVCNTIDLFRALRYRSVLVVLERSLLEAGQAGAHNSRIMQISIEQEALRFSTYSR